MKKTRLICALLALLLALSILAPGMVYAGDPEQTDEVMSGEVLPEPTETEEETAPPEQEPAAAVTEEPEKAETAVPEEKAVPEKEETPVSREEPAPAVNDQTLPEEPAVQEEEPEQPGEPEKEAGEDSPEMPAGPDETPAEILESAQPEEPESVSGAEDASAGEPAAFENGYVLVRKQTKVYAGTNTRTVRGTFPEDGVAWAVRATDNEDPRKAWDRIHDEAIACEGELVVVTVGPETNLALALQKYPDLKHLIKKITVMGGSLTTGNVSEYAEANLWHDAEAARIVFDSGIPIDMIGLNVTRKAPLKRSIFDGLTDIREDETRSPIRSGMTCC